VKATRGRQTRVIALVLAGFIVVAGILLALDWNGVRQVVQKAEWRLTLVAVLFSLMSDFCLSYDYALINKAFSIPLGSLESTEVGFVSSAMNNILAFMGAAGHSLRLVLTRGRGIESGEIIAASIFHSYVNNVMMLALLVAGIASVLFGHVVYGGNLAALGLLLVVLVILFFVVTAMIVLRSLRSWVLRVTGAIWHFFSHRDISPFLGELDNALGRGLQALRQRPFFLSAVLLVMAAQWAFAAGSLWFCFYALGRAPHLGVLLSGFGIGISAGNLSFVPGGLGVQEASMAGVFALMGTPFAQAALASILFRVTNNFVPFIFSLGLYWELLRRLGRPPVEGE